MRLITVAVLAVGIVLCSASAASAGDQGGEFRPAGSVNDGRPTAIVIADGSGGTVASWSSRRSGGSSGRRWTCSYHDIGAQPGVYQIEVKEAPASVLEEGKPYGLLCVDEGGDSVYQQMVIWDPRDPFSGLVPAEERLAEEALASISLPLPVPSMSPPVGADHLVGLETWMWLDAWVPVTATATLGGVAATVVAEPVRVRWSMGDGTERTCAGPGRPFGGEEPGRRAAGDVGSTGACTHVWVDPSATRPDGVFAVTATVEWQVSWTSTTGAAGDLGVLTSASTTPVSVVEAQAVIDY